MLAFVLYSSTKQKPLSRPVEKRGKQRKREALSLDNIWIEPEQFASQPFVEVMAYIYLFFFLLLFFWAKEKMKVSIEKRRERKEPQKMRKTKTKQNKKSFHWIALTTPAFWFPRPVYPPSRSSLPSTQLHPDGESKPRRETCGWKTGNPALVV